MNLHSLVEHLQRAVDIYKHLLEAEETLVERFNSYPVNERFQDEAHGLRVQYNAVHYQRILAGVGLFNAKMDLFYVTGDNEEAWPAQLRRHHPNYDTA
jgi:hypothetical protein